MNIDILKEQNIIIYESLCQQQRACTVAKVKARACEEKISQMTVLKTKHSHRNAIQREATKVNQLAMQRVENNRLLQSVDDCQKDLSNMRQDIENLEVEKHSAIEDVEKHKKQKVALQKRLSKMMLKVKGCEEPPTFKDLKEQVKGLEVENDMMKEQVDDLMQHEYIQTFKGKKYSDDIRIVYMELLKQNVSIKNCETIVKTVLDKLAGKHFDRLPKKSFAAIMLQESSLLAKMQCGTAILQSNNSTLAFDGTTKHFKEYATFNITTGEGQGLSLGFEDLPCGDTASYFNSTRNVIYDMAKLLLPKDATEKDIDTKVATLLSKIKNCMSDRHIVNKALTGQIEEWRTTLIEKNLQQLTEEQQQDLLRMNHLWCGLHVIINIGSTA